jgi:hypothetical protein
MQKTDDGSVIVRIMLNTFSRRGEPTSIKFDAAFAKSPVAPSSPQTFSEDAGPSSYSNRGELIGQIGTWALTGEIARQDLASVSASNFSGKVFSIALLSAKPSEPVEPGDFRFTVNREDSGSLPNATGVSGSLAAFDASGRSLLTITAANAPAIHYATYAISRSDLFLVAIDAAESIHTPRSGEALEQSMRQ